MKDISVVLKGAWCHSYPNKEAAPNSKNHRFVWGRRKRKLTRLVSKAAPTNSWSSNQTSRRTPRRAKAAKPQGKRKTQPTTTPCLPADHLAISLLLLSSHAGSPCPIATAAAECRRGRIRPQRRPAASPLESGARAPGRMDRASEELDRRSRYLSALVRRTKLADPPQPEPEPEPEPEVVETKAKADVEPELKASPRPHVGGEGEGVKEEAKASAAVKARGEVKAAEGRKVAVCVRAADMPLPLQRRAVRIAVEAVAAMPRLESKRLALALKKVNRGHWTESFFLLVLFEPVVFYLWICLCSAKQISQLLLCQNKKIKACSFHLCHHKSRTNAYTGLWLIRSRIRSRA